MTASTRDGRAFDVYVARSERPLLWAALGFLVLLVAPLFDLSSGLQTTVQVANLALWAVFAVDYAVRLYLAPRRWEFVRRHPLDLALVIVPFLRPLRAARLLRLLRVGVVAGNVQGRARRSLHASVALYVGLSAAVLLIVAAVAMYQAERDAEDGNIHSFADALWWAATTVTTVGYGDRYPTTTQGRLVAVGLMVVGIALLGVVTATVAAWFVDRLRRVEQTEEQTAATLDQVLEELQALRARVDDLGAR